MFFMVLFKVGSFASAGKGGMCSSSGLKEVVELERLPSLREDGGKRMAFIFTSLFSLRVSGGRNVQREGRGRSSRGKLRLGRETGKVAGWASRRGEAREVSIVLICLPSEMSTFQYSFQRA